MTSKLTRRATLSIAAYATFPWLSGTIHAQSWPSKPIRFVVPFAPGGTSEIVARSVSAELGKQLGQTVYVENKPGGAGVPAMQEVAKAAPDGHTLILGHVGTLAVNPYMLKNQPYDVNRDFIPVTLLAKVPNVFVIHPDVPAKNFREFVDYVKKHPGQLNYGSAGNASAGHLAMEYLKLVTGMFITHIPYRGTGPQLTDLLAGRTQASSAGMPALGARTFAVASCARLRWARNSASLLCRMCPRWRSWASKILRPRSGTACWCLRAHRPMWSSGCKKSRLKR
jgi:tripartite-type tricarboxylate transporter receptor subunit TctC